MQREEIITQHEAAMLAAASELFGAADDGWALVPEYEGCAHLVYSYTHQGQPRVLRVSFRPDRTVDQITAELHFVNDLAVHGVRVSTPVLSRNRAALATIKVDGVPFHLVSLVVKDRGTRIPDSGYRYRDGAPIEEYFQNWGRVLGQMHACAKGQHPISAAVTRPDWFDLHAAELDPSVVSESVALAPTNPF